MKPKNFPARKLKRQQKAKGVIDKDALARAREERSKKMRGTQ